LLRPFESKGAISFSQLTIIHFIQKQKIQNLENLEKKLLRLSQTNQSIVQYVSLVLLLDQKQFIKNSDKMVKNITQICYVVCMPVRK